jgi:Lrp/AsnC family transcriptional regulator
MKFDERDLAILSEVQQDASLSIDELSERVHLSRNACWRRMKALEEAGVIRARVALVDPRKVNAGLTVLILIRTSQHSEGWAEKFRDVVATIPEIVGAYRTAGDLDYILKARVKDVEAYDGLYKRLIARIDMGDVSASFVMESLKETTQTPLTYA